MRKIPLIILFVAVIAGGAFFFARLFAPQPGVAEAPTSPVIREAPDNPPERTILFVGDIMLDRSVKNRMLEAQDPAYPFARIADTLRSADLAFANLEGPISARGTNQGSKYSFRFEPTATMNALAFSGIDVVSIANNHIWDWGTDALSDTVLHLDQYGIGHVGAGRDVAEANQPFFAQLDRTSAAMLGYTTLYPKSLEAGADHPGISSFELESAKKTVADLKNVKGTDIVVVSLHWGTEYESHPDEGQRLVARALIDSGADLVIGHHPHVVADVEQYGDGYIAYSLGNFIFDQYFSRETMSGLMLKARVKDGKLVGVEQIPVQLTPTFQPFIPGQPGDPALDVIE